MWKILSQAKILRALSLTMDDFNLVELIEVRNSTGCMWNLADQQSSHRQHFTEESPSKEEKLLDLNEIFSPHCHFLSFSSNFSTDIPSAVFYPLTPASFAEGTNEWKDMCCVQRNIQHANSIIVADGDAGKEELSDKKQPGDCIDELGYLQQLTA